MTESELRAIRRSSMARILCDNSQVGLMAIMVVMMMVLIMVMMMVMIVVLVMVMMVTTNDIHNNYKFITGG